MAQLLKTEISDYYKSKVLSLSPINNKYIYQKALAAPKAHIYVVPEKVILFSSTSLLVGLGLMLVGRGLKSYCI